MMVVIDKEDLIRAVMRISWCAKLIPAQAYRIIYHLNIKFDLHLSAQDMVDFAERELKDNPLGELK